MRSLSQSVIARSIIVILLFSVLTPILLYDEKIVEEESEQLEEITLLSVSGRAKANHYLTSAGRYWFEYASVMAGFGHGNIVAGICDIICGNIWSNNYQSY